jgi:phospholipid/cholesterol/gamma-HCH transport system ATP-binding protein
MADLATPSAEVAVAARALRTDLGGAAVQDGLSLEVRRGDIFALAGPNGCGKSLLLRQALGLEQPDAGSLVVLGQEVVGLGAVEALRLRRRCGVVFERAALFSSLTVAENVAFPLRERTRLRGRFLAGLAAMKLALVGVPPAVAARYPAELSGGMRRRAALARAIVLDPELLFLDEPSAGLDPESARSFETLIQHLRALLGLTIVVVTRELGLLWNTADRVAFLGAGRVVASGSMDELSRSDAPLVRSYLGRARAGAPGGQR